ncbi:MAG: hypothetical protein LH480_15520 [Rubrivivax sp.]|nr:hypothetical protein [Rubrivivax sp.]
MGLNGSKTEQNSKDAFAGESQAIRRYLYFANRADVEGQNDVAMLFRSTAVGEKPAMPTGTCSFSSMAPATRPPACPSATAA